MAHTEEEYTAGLEQGSIEKHADELGGSTESTFGKVKQRRRVLNRRFYLTALAVLVASVVAACVTHRVVRRRRFVSDYKDLTNKHDFVIASNVTLAQLPLNISKWAEESCCGIEPTCAITGIGYECSCGELDIKAGHDYKPELGSYAQYCGRRLRISRNAWQMDIGSKIGYENAGNDEIKMEPGDNTQKICCGSLKANAFPGKFKVRFSRAFRITPDMKLRIYNHGNFHTKRRVRLSFATCNFKHVYPCSSCGTYSGTNWGWVEMPADKEVNVLFDGNSYNQGGCDDYPTR